MAPQALREACNPTNFLTSRAGLLIALNSSPMKPLLAASLAVCGLLLVASAFADETEPRPAANASTAPPAAPVVVPVCRLSEHTGVTDADATTAGRFVCAEI